jgi:hypothetical protein
MKKRDSSDALLQHADEDGDRVHSTANTVRSHNHSTDRKNSTGGNSNSNSSSNSRTPSSSLPHAALTLPLNATPQARISRDLWIATLLITTQSFIFGYAFSSINPCLAIGKADESGDCIHTHGLCPPGSLYNDVDMSTIQVHLCIRVCVLSKSGHSVFLCRCPCVMLFW